MAPPSKAIFLRDQMHVMRNYPRACAICGENLDQDSTFNNTHAPVRLEACRHVFGMRCIVDWTNTTSQTNHNKCPICLKRLFVKDDLSSGTDRSSRSHTSSRHESVEPSASRNAYRGNPRYAARAETVSDSASTVRPSRHSSRNENVESSGRRSEVQLDPRTLQPPTSRHASRHGDAAPSKSRDAPQVNPRSFDTSSRQQASPWENVPPTGARNVPGRHPGHSQPAPQVNPRDFNPRREDTRPSRPRNMPQVNPGYAVAPPPTYQPTAASSRSYVYVDASRNPYLITRSQGPPPPLDEFELRRASWNKPSGPKTKDSWTS
ncbi:hypothetical protein P171DRAFT_486805 [Karstenula rhodostoma CBS 690.94]|uniref:RING-type domain-containing protein n=1 Tax=Karstenula rhodostoma CBS 690.94 TaxID=1392251 RepID=A0A9P4PF24_9PLEO|nr:hypothetical protein P171DRAFT_486805 [Karstenula rhodostoma CBS 690.94]